VGGFLLTFAGNNMAMKRRGTMECRANIKTASRAVNIALDVSPEAPEIG
jgi:hypothetical protein